MKYAFAREPTRKSLESLEGYYSNKEHSQFSDRGFIDRSAPVGPTLQYDWAIDPPVPDDADDDKRVSRKGLIHLVRRLKCGKVTSQERKQRQLGFEMNPRKRYDGIADEGWGYHQQTKSPIRYSRNVNITVERGDAPTPTTNYPRRQSSFSDLEAPGFRSVRGRKSDGHYENNYFSPIMLLDQPMSPKIGIEPISVQKERWLKLIQQGWNETHDQQGWNETHDQQGWNETHDERVAMSSGAGDHSPARASSSRRCDSSNSNSGDTDYTTESDETDPSNPQRSAPRKVHNSHNESSRRRGSTHPRRPTNMESKNDLWEELAEDLGIFAGLLIADGSACVGTLSDITRETVAHSCNSHDLPAELDTFYGMDVRDHSLLGSD